MPTKRYAKTLGGSTVRPVLAKDILRAGVQVNYLLPKIIWESPELSGNDIKVFNQIFYRCAKLEAIQAKVKRTEEGCPILYTPKEEIAEKCHMTESTFRACVKNLRRLGLLTKRLNGMAGTYGVAISSTFFNKLIDMSQVTRYDKAMDKFYASLIKTLYTLDIVISTKDIKEYEEYDNKAFSKEKKNFNFSKKEKQESPIVRVPIVEEKDIIRVPITTKIGTKTSSLVSEENKKVVSISREKLFGMQSDMSSSDIQVLKVVRYYEYLARKAYNATGYKAISYKQPREHKNWKFFEKVSQLCNKMKWDYQVYLDSQFDRVKYWNHKTKAPYPNQLYSEGAQKYFLTYVKDIQDKYGIDGKGKVKSKGAKSVSKEVIDSVMQDCEFISSHLSQALKRSTLTPEQEKALFIYHKWPSLSPYYLSTIPWFDDILAEHEEDDKELSEDYRDKLYMIRHSKSVSETTVYTVREMEKHFNIPPTIDFS